MYQRISRHIFFWFCFVTLYVIQDLLFPPPSDLVYPVWQRVLRFFFSELSLLPWKAIPFYALFYFLIPRYFSKGAYIKTIVFFLLVLAVCVLGYRSMIAPISQLLYNESPDFNVYSLKRLLYTTTDLLPALGLAASVKLLIGSMAFRKKEVALQKEKRAAELSFLKAQTNPHFLFNTLNNLYGLARKDDNATADYILKLSNIVRYILQECSSPTIPVENEVTVIRDYVALEKLRYDDRLVVVFNVDIKEMHVTIPPLLLLPFVENAFKHGVSETRSETFVTIELNIADGMLNFYVINGRGEDAPAHAAGIGLTNVKRQLDLIYRDNYSLKAAPEGDVFNVHLCIQLNHDNG
ncbi:MAG: histidine kinase [Bacteroidota bacterium]